MVGTVWFSGTRRFSYHNEREIEDALALHAVVQPAVPGAGSPELASELIDFCRSRIAHYKAPCAVSFEDQLPRLPSGKMLRRLLMDRYRSLPST
jgi:acyl-coenzyme A synthetase/AMP-(fatty) acid ligase